MGEFASGQVNDIQQVAQVAEAPGANDGGLHLAVDGFGCGVGQLVLIGRQNAWQMIFQGFPQLLEGLQPATPRPENPATIERARLFALTRPPVDVLEALLTCARRVLFCDPSVAASACH